MSEPISDTELDVIESAYKQVHASVKSTAAAIILELIPELRRARRVLRHIGIDPVILEAAFFAKATTLADREPPLCTAEKG